MNRFFLLFLSLILSVTLFGKGVSVEQAKVVATVFLQQATVNTLKSAAPIRLTLVRNLFTETSGTNGSLKSARAASPEIYVFTINQSEGFIMVSGDDAAIPVLGYSLTERLDTTRALPDNLRFWLEGYRQQIRQLRVAQVAATDHIKSLWKGISGPLKSTKSAVLPLTKTKWDQTPYYNDLCPYDSQYQEPAVVGCVATAMAQIMKYWEYPSRGFGVHAYQLDRYGILSADFGATRYDWAAMPDSVGGPNEAVATLMYHCGVGVDMIYHAGGGSGAMTTFSASFPDRMVAETAFTTFFGYTSSIRGLYRKNFNDSDWKNIILDEMNSGRPVLYAGSGDGYGHAFVCDGYDENEYFHMNWGWSGLDNGYFLLDALNPFMDIAFNLGQCAVVGIQPPDPTRESVLELATDGVPNKITVEYDKEFRLFANVLNAGSRNFYGDFCVGIYDDQLFLVDLVDIKTGQSLSTGNQHTNPFSFTSDGLGSMIPGTYRAYIQYRPEGEQWRFLQSQEGYPSLKEYTEIEVVHHNAIHLFAPMQITSGPIFPNDTLSVWLNVVNDSIADFTGTLSLGIYTLQGDFVTTVEGKTNIQLPSNAHFNQGLSFMNPHIAVEPGRYLLKLMHRWDGSVYECTGSTQNYLNPTQIEVREPHPTPDIYEVNDSIEISYSFPLQFESNQATINSLGSNLHSTTDVDYYSLSLEPGYDYFLFALLHDACNNTRLKRYSADGKFNYSTDGTTWSEQYDEEMPHAIHVSGGGSPVYFQVAPFSHGDMGTYMLEIRLNRSITTSTDPLQPTPKILVYPNPFSDYVTVSCPESIQEYQLFDMQGRLQKKSPVNDTQVTINLSSCIKGMYILRITSGNQVYARKIMKR